MIEKLYGDYGDAAYLSKHELERAERYFRLVRMAKYPRRDRRIPLYGDRVRSFSTEQLFAFFDELYRFKNRRVYACFALMFFYGLRVGEIGSCRLLLDQGIVEIEEDKATGVSKQFRHLPFIEGTQGLFRLANEPLPFNSNYLRTYFTETCKRLGDEFWVAYGQDTLTRNRHQFTTHTLRHTAALIVENHTGSAFKMHRFLRHQLRSHYGTSGYYMSWHTEKMRCELNEAFKLYVDRILIGS